MNKITVDILDVSNHRSSSANTKNSMHDSNEYLMGGYSFINTTHDHACTAMNSYHIIHFLLPGSTPPEKVDTYNREMPDINEWREDL